MTDGPVVLMGCGRLGSAIVEGWLKTGALSPERLMILTPSMKPAAETAVARGARVNPGAEALAEAAAVVVSVKPAMWRAASEPVAPQLPADAAVVSVMAGVRAASLSEVFEDRAVARVMPTTGVAQGQGVASIWASSEAARMLATGLFAPMAEVVDLKDEGLIDAATAVSGSGPAYFHAFAKALAEAGVAEGLDPADAVRLARATLRSAAAGLEDGADLDALIARVASPGGTTQAGLKALDEAKMPHAAAAAVQAAARRARELSANG